jgi:hypothetical protein
MPSLSSLVTETQTLELLFDDECGDPFRSRVGIRLGVNDERIGITAIGDPHLRAVQDVVVALPFGPQLHADNV